MIWIDILGWLLIVGIEVIFTYHMFRKNPVKEIEKQLKV